VKRTSPINNVYIFIISLYIFIHVSIQSKEFMVPTRIRDNLTGSNTLHIAATAGHTELCQWLISDDYKRAQKKLENISSITILDDKNNIDNDDDDNEKVILKNILTIENDNHDTPIVLAAENGHLKTLKTLVQFNVLNNNMDDDCENNGKKSNGVTLYEIRRRNCFGFPPFHYACSRGQLETCKWLLVHGGVNFDEKQMNTYKRQNFASLITSLDHVDSALLLRMTLCDRSTSSLASSASSFTSSSYQNFKKQNGGSRFIHADTKKLLLQWCFEIRKQYNIFIQTILFGICQPFEAHHPHGDAPSSSVSEHDDIQQEIKKKKNDQNTQIEKEEDIKKQQNNNFKTCGVSGLKDDNDEEARLQILKNGLMRYGSMRKNESNIKEMRLNRNKVVSKEEMRLKRIEAFEKKHIQSNQHTLKEEVISNEEDEEVKLTSLFSQEVVYRGGGCPKNGLPMLQGFEESVTILIADFLGIKTGRELRFIREFSDICQQ